MTSAWAGVAATTVDVASAVMTIQARIEHLGRMVGECTSRHPASLDIGPRNKRVVGVFVVCVTVVVSIQTGEPEADRDERALERRADPPNLAVCAVVDTPTCVSEPETLVRTYIG